MARPTQSVALYMQSLGRATRLKSKEYIKKYLRNDATILDFVDNAGKNKLVNHWTIEKGKTIDERVLISDEQKLIYKDKIKKIREARINSQYKYDKKLNLFSLPKKTRIKHHGRMLDEATEKQLEWLKNEGIWQPGIKYTKGQASEFITNLAAKGWMKRNLAKWNFNVKDDVTIGQYYEAKAAYTKRMVESRNVNV